MAIFLRPLLNYCKLLMMKPFSLSSYLWCVSLFLLLGWHQPVLGQEITILTSSNIPAYQDAVQGFRATLPPSVSVAQYQVPKSFEEGKALGQKIRASNTQLVYTVGLKATLLAKVEIIDVPVVFSSVFFPERYELPPHMYGIAMNVSVEEQFQHFRRLLPKLNNLGVLYDRKNMAGVIDRARKVASEQQFTMRAVPVEDIREVPSALRELLPQIDALWLLPDPLVTSSDSLAFILETVTDHNVPLLGFSPGLVRHGALASVSGDARGIGRKAGRLALSLVRGEGTASGRTVVATAPPTLALNLNTAELLGVTPPPTVLKLADALFGGPSAFARRGVPGTLQDSTDPNQTIAIP